uniref:Uncharacterized protein n=1 Tax=Chenopodium quinoa TaxID=63459 RepID=A0A803KUA4_CHEQI
MRMGAMVLGEKPQLANMQLLNAGVVGDEVPKGEAHSINEEASVKQQGNLVFVNGEVNGCYARLLVDSGASHNFLSLREAKDLGIKFTKGGGEMKVVNAESTPLHLKAWKVHIHLGKWKGKVDLLIADMDDEDVVLGMEFINSVTPSLWGKV